MPSSPASVTYAFATQPGPIPLSELDTNFGQLVTADNNLNAYGNYFVDSSGAANAITVTVPGTLGVALAAGLPLQIKVANATTGATTISVNALGSKSLVNGDGSAITSGQLVVGQVITVIYDGSKFYLQNWSINSLTNFANINVTGNAIPANGMYLPAANTLGLSSNSTLRWSVNSTGNHVFTSPSSGSTIALTTTTSNAVGLIYTGSGAGVAQFNISNTSGSVGAAAGLDLSDGASSGGIKFNGATNTGAFPTGSVAGTVISVFCNAGPVQIAPNGTVSMLFKTTGVITIAPNTAIAAGGAAANGITFTSTANYGVFTGSGAPTMSAAKGSIYLRSDGTTTNNRSYINTDGAGTWTAITTVA